MGMPSLPAAWPRFVANTWTHNIQHEYLELRSGTLSTLPRQPLWIFIPIQLNISSVHWFHNASLKKFVEDMKRFIQIPLQLGQEQHAAQNMSRSRLNESIVWHGISPSDRGIAPDRRYCPTKHVFSVVTHKSAHIFA